MRQSLTTRRECAAKGHSKFQETFARGARYIPRPKALKGAWGGKQEFLRDVVPTSPPQPIGRGMGEPRGVPPSRNAKRATRRIVKQKKHNNKTSAFLQSQIIMYKNHTTFRIYPSEPGAEGGAGGLRTSPMEFMLFLKSIRLLRSLFKSSSIFTSILSTKVFVPVFISAAVF